MNKMINKLVLLIILSISYSTQAINLVPDAIATHVSSNSIGTQGNAYLNDEAISLHFELKIPAGEQGFNSHLYLAAIAHDHLFMKNGNGQWLPWDGHAHTLVPYKSKLLQAKENIPVLTDETLPNGEYLAYVGYLSRSGDIVYNTVPSSLVVFAKQSANLINIKRRATLNEFLSQSERNYYKFAPVSIGLAEADSSSNNTAPAVSQTNLQEIGVDEADRIKTIGDRLFALETCADNSSECIRAYQLQESPAAALKLGEIDLKSDFKQGVIYAPVPNLDNPQQNLIWISKTQNINFILPRLSVLVPQQLSTEMHFINVADPANMRISKTLQFDGSVLSSRLIGGTLYLVTHYNPVAVLPVADVPENEIQTPTTALDYPTFQFDQQAPAELNPNDCLLTPKSSESALHASMYTLIAIPIHQPEQMTTQCIIGAIETLYASTESLYLASTRYSYQAVGNSIFYPGIPNYQTDIHKFAITDNGIEYRASGQVNGHLGWEMDKKSFRMGEHNGILKIATSLGQTWDDSATTQVTVLSEDRQSQQLQTLATLKNLGKPGERLYAARFIGDRGYLVTFKVIDPLIVLDFTDPMQPQILGELEIEGYSDYLHPVDENYLLGIGKDAIVDPANEADSSRGAWYQGLKLSLFDLSNFNNIVEVNSLIIGKRGTSSPVLLDHHALAWLQNTANAPAKLALPIDLHETAPVYEGVDLSQPNVFYNWTLTGLYYFNINTGENPGISLSGKLITESLDNGDSQPFNSHNDRAVIQGETLHFIHNNRVFSSSVADLQ